MNAKYFFSATFLIFCFFFFFFALTMLMIIAFYLIFGPSKKSVNFVFNFFSQVKLPSIDTEPMILTMMTHY